MCLKNYKQMKYILAISLLLTWQNVKAEEIYFACDMQLPDYSRDTYTFSFNESANELYLVESSQDMKVIRNNKTQLWASQTTKTYRKFNYDYLTFYLNRVTGTAEISYSTQRTEADIKKCKNNPKYKHKWSCDAQPVLTDKTERGVCKIVKRKI